MKRGSFMSRTAPESNNTETGMPPPAGVLQD